MPAPSATAALAVDTPVRSVAVFHPDTDWDVPKGSLDRADLNAYRGAFVLPDDNRALRACAAFTGDALIVESEHDDLVPHPTIANYVGAFRQAHSLTYRVIKGADHALSGESSRNSCSSLPVGWIRETVPGARRCARRERLDQAGSITTTGISRSVFFA